MFLLGLVPVPVSDIDRAKAFYAGLGFYVDVDVRPADGVRVVQLTPPGSACSITLARGIPRLAFALGPVPCQSDALEPDATAPRQRAMLHRWLEGTVAGFSLVVALSACGSSSALEPQSGTPTTSMTSSELHPTREGNERLTAEEAQRLLGLAVVPPGSVEIATLVVSVPQALGTPMDKSLVEKTKQWQVPMAFDDAVEWMRSHPPAGLQTGASSLGSGPGSWRTAGSSYLAANSTAWIHAELDVSIITNGSGRTYIRVDGRALWLDPTPVRDRARGLRMRLTVAGGCPESDANAHGVRNDGADLDSRLLPAGAPTAALVCRYAGMNGAAFSLVAHRTLGGAQAAQLAAAINRTRLSHTAGGPHSCPMDDRSAEILVFSYPGRSDVAIWYTATGCRSVANGHISASAVDLPNVEALAGG